VEWVFGWPVQLSVCGFALVCLSYVRLRWRKISPWHSMAILDATGVAWCLYWFGWSMDGRRWVSAVLLPLPMLWLSYKAIDIWRQRETRHLPYRL